MLWDRCLSVCDVGVLWPNGWMDQDVTYMKVGLGPGDIMLDGNPPPKKGVLCQKLGRGAVPPPQFLAHVYCGQTDG